MVTPHTQHSRWFCSACEDWYGHIIFSRAIYSYVDEVDGPCIRVTDLYKCPRCARILIKEILEERDQKILTPEEQEALDAKATEEHRQR